MSVIRSRLIVSNSPVITKVRPLSFFSGSDGALLGGAFARFFAGAFFFATEAGAGEAAAGADLASYGDPGLAADFFAPDACAK
jgi:hypothetical protein